MLDVGVPPVVVVSVHERIGSPGLVQVLEGVPVVVVIIEDASERFHARVVETRSCGTYGANMASVLALLNNVLGDEGSLLRLRQKNVPDRQTWVTSEELRIAIVTGIEHDYDQYHRQDTRGRLPRSSSTPS